MTPYSVENDSPLLFWDFVLNKFEHLKGKELHFVMQSGKTRHMSHKAILQK